MAQIHPNWLIHERVGDDKEALVQAAKRPRQPNAKLPAEQAVKPIGEKRNRKGKR